MLIIMSGLPGTGKTTIARAVARLTGAVHLRIDTIEQAIVRSGVARQPLDEAGYIVGYALAEDHLRLGMDVIADSVNPLQITRAAWRRVAKNAGVPCIEVEIVCSDRKEHQRRATSRFSDIPDLVLPNWRAIVEREYHPWDHDHIVVDTAGRSVDECAGEVVDAIDHVRRGS